MNSKVSMEPVGAYEVKRQIDIPSLDRESEGLLINLFSALDGICHVETDVTKKQLSVRYDASKTSYSTILDKLKQLNFPPLESRWSRIKTSWYQFLDENIRENAHAPPPACCNKPPKGGL